ASWGRELAVERADVSIMSEGDILEQGGDPVYLDVRRHDSAMLALTVYLHIPHGIQVGCPPSDGGWIDWDERIFAVHLPPSWQEEEAQTRRLELRYDSGVGAREVRVLPAPQDLAWAAQYGYRLAANAYSVDIVLQAAYPTPELRVTQTYTNQSPIEVELRFSEPVYGFDVSDPSRVYVENATVQSTNMLEGQLLDHFAFWVTPESEGEISMQVLAGATTNESGVDAVDSDTLYFVYDVTAPSRPEDPKLHEDSDSSGGFAITHITENLQVVGQVEAYATAQAYVDGEFVDGRVTGADGQYQLTIPGPLADGSYRLQVDAVDRAGNVSDKSNDLTVVIKTSTEDPRLSLLESDDTGEYNNDGVTRITMPKVVGSAEANASLTLNVLETEAEYRTTVDSQGDWTIDMSDALDDGEYTLRATVTDIADNRSQAEMSVRIDTLPPILSQVNAGVLTDGEPTFILAASEALYGFTGEVLRVRDAHGNDMEFDLEGADRVDFTIRATSPPQVTGEVRVEIIDQQAVVDLAGNPLQEPSIYTVYYDDNPVDLEITPDDAGLTNGENITVTFYFARTVDEFTEDDIDVSNASIMAGTLQANAQNREFTVEVDLSDSSDGPVIVAVNAGAAFARDGGNLSRDANAVVATIDRSGPMLTHEYVRIVGQAPPATQTFTLVDIAGENINLSTDEALQFDPETRSFTLVVQSGREVLRLRATSESDPLGTTQVIYINQLTEKPPSVD
ncbi:MAG: hypothetical protein EA401_09860, partial [Planctomycetota bacterium]